MKIEEIMKSKYFKWTLIIIGELVIILAAFSAGRFVGFKKAAFSYQWGENYRKNFGGPIPMPGLMMGGPIGPEGPLGRDFMGQDLIDAHGTGGTILSIFKAESTDSASSSKVSAIATLIIKGDDNTEKKVIIMPQTMIRGNRETLRIDDLKAGDNIMIIGEPSNSGEIEAKFLRVFKNN